ncbi:MAG TPA: tripartite tricarboxylate transporter substrate-binding protein, partial [Burkholderiales bacterium]|nr:tripartite tricarboxylate transporter substrate-binding protein [Burkholderiales bacterium]
MKRSCGAFVAALAALVSAPSHAQDYPSRPIRLIIGFPTGGNVDVVGRIVAQKMGEGFGRQVLPENRTGAGSIIANEYVAKSAADGYTLLVVSGAFVTQAATTRKLPYDPARDFSWIST